MYNLIARLFSTEKHCTLLWLVFVVLLNSFSLNGQVELIQNGDFSYINTGWQTTGDLHYSSTFGCCKSCSPTTGYAYVSDNAGQAKDNASGVMYQTISVPSNTLSATLTFSYSITTQETTTSLQNDNLYVFFYWNGGSNVQSVITLSNLNKTGNSSGCNAYNTYSYSVPSSLYGLTLDIRFGTATNSNLKTTFRIDDVSLIAYLGSSSCITWAGGSAPSDTMLLNAAEKLCASGIIDNYQNAGILSGAITQIDFARYMGRALLGNSEPVFMDYFPNIFPALQNMSVSDQRYIKLMLYLEYISKIAPQTGTDDISPFSRECFYPNFFGTIRKSEGTKAMLETWNLDPSMVFYDATSTAYSSVICDILLSNKYSPWIHRAQVLGILSGITAPCSGNSVSFGPDNALSYREFYIMLSRLIYIPAPTSIKDEDFFKPNLFYINNLNTSVGLEKGVFHEYANNSFSIPSGGLGLDFQHSYHSNLTEIPITVSTTVLEEDIIKPKQSPIGGGWTHSYSAFIRIIENNGVVPERILIFWPDGAIHSFLVKQNKYETIGVQDILTVDSFNSVNQPSKVTIKKGRVTYTFRNIDAVGLCILSLMNITDAHNNSLNFDYVKGVSAFGGWEPQLLSKVTDSYSGRSLKFTYWSNSNYLKTVSDPLGRTLTYYPNEITHDLDSFVDAKNQSTKYFYRELMGTTIFRTHLLTRIIKPKGNEITNSYYSKKLNQTQSASYLIKVEAVPNYKNSWTQQTSKITETQGNQSIQTNFTFDALGNIINTTTSTNTIKRDYNSDNRIIKEQDVDAGFTTQYEYDSYGYVSKKTVTDDLFGETIRYEYVNNSFGELLQFKDYNDHMYFRQTNFYRNAQGDVTEEIQNEGFGGELRKQFTYSTDGLLVGYYFSSIREQISYSYNSFGNLKTIVTYSNPVGQFLKEQFVYDTVSRLIEHIDKNGNANTYTYDANDNLISAVKDPSLLRLTTNYGYDANDNAISITSPKGNTTTLKYDFNTDALIEENDGSSAKKWRYNTDGSLDSFITKKGVKFNYQYYTDALFPGTKLTGLLFSDGVSYFQYWDKTKALYHVNNSQGKGNRFWYGSGQRGKWNRPGLISSEGFFTSNDNMTYDYDLLGRPTMIAYPPYGGKDYNYGFIYEYVTKNLEKVFNRNTNKIYATYAYNKDGKPFTTTYSNGDSILYHYDKYNRLDSIVGKNKKGQILYSIGATLDNNGKHIGENTQLFYQGKEVTTLPPLVLLTSESYTYSQQNNSITGSGRNYNSNLAGEITSASNPSVTYSWTDYGQLKEVNNNGVKTEYDYDALGNRRRKDNIYYLVDQQNTGNMVMEATQGTNPISAYIYGNGLVARIDPVSDSLFYYHYDFRGSVIAITNENGDMVQYYKYEDYGKIYDSKGTLSWNNPFRYVGRWGVQYDDSDVYYMKARYYQPSTGRFISEDPIWNTNLFVYGDDDPVNNIDPSGRYFETALDIISLSVNVAGFAKNPSWWGAAYIAADLATTALPGAAAGGTFLKGAVLTRKAAKASRGVDNFIIKVGELSSVKGAQQGFIKGNVDVIFNSLTNGGKSIAPNRFKLPNGSIITKYLSSSGLPTIQINKGSGQVFKIRVR